MALRHGHGNRKQRIAPPTHRIAGKIPLALLMAFPFLSGCQHQDPVDTVSGWWHDYEGGEIARLRPPPPGQNDPYPHLGRTPTQAPDLPSPEARLSLTMQLENQRNLAQRQSASNGALPTIPPPPPKSTPAPPGGSVSSDQASMTMTSAGQTDASSTSAQDAIFPTGAPQSGPSAPSASAPPASAHPAHPASTPAASKSPGARKQNQTKETSDTTTSGQDAALPPVVRQSIPETPPGQFPQIGNMPPPAPSFPGFDIPQDANLAGPIQPDIDTATPDGTLIRFQPSTDQIAGNPQASYQHIIAMRGKQKLVVRAFGAAMSAEAGLTPQDQTREIALALLRARAVAHGLMLRGVPASDIILRAEAIGDGVRVTLGG